jgi:CHAT domain-containing protein
MNADFLLRHDREAEALPLFQEATELSDRLFAQTRGVNETAREQLLKYNFPIYAKAVANLLRLSAKTRDPAHAKAALAEVSRTQSRLFTEQLRVAAAARFREDRSFRRLDEARVRALESEIEASRQFTLLGRLDPISGEARLARPSSDPQALARQEADLRSRHAAWTQARSARDEAEAALWRDYPSYMELQAPRPVTVEDLQQRWLRPGEAVLAYFLLQDRLAVFVVTPDRFRLATQPAGREEITRLVSAARKPMEQGGMGALKNLDPAVLHQLYRLLLAPVAQDLRGVQRILAVGDGPIHTLPLEMLVTRWGESEQRAYAEAARKGDLSQYATLDYVGAQHRISYWPSLAALAYQRGQARPEARFKRQLVAFADPVFEDGDGGVPAATRAVLSHLGGINRGGIRIPRLPETADEAREAAAILGGRHDVYLREEAREARAKTMNLGDVRYLHFATHGLLGGEFNLLKADQENGDTRTRSLGVVEDDEPTPPAKKEDRGQPALVLSLVGNEEGEDGLLSMGEVIERMRLNSDLVILSACNTAGEKDSAKTGEGFAGLTRAFMHAGARGLLVSYWSVESQATKDLVVDTFRQLKAGQPAHAALGQARDKLRQGYSAGLRVSQAHPFFWAPFVHVGD